VVEADRALVAAWTRVTVADRPYASPEVIEDFVRLSTRQHDLGVRFLVALAGDEPVGSMRVFPGHDTAQVEELDVVATHRGRGLGALLLGTALAVTSNRDLVFLTADPDDWPAAWYARLGFGVAGRSSGFRRLPEAAHGS
jgi:ribosomal protein S18 acetylase RimI-like enzyme